MFPTLSSCSATSSVFVDSRRASSACCSIVRRSSSCMIGKTPSNQNRTDLSRYPNVSQYICRQSKPWPSESSVDQPPTADVLSCRADENFVCGQSNQGRGLGSEQAAALAGAMGRPCSIYGPADC